MRGEVRLSVSASEWIARPSVSHCRCVSPSCCTRACTRSARRSASRTARPPSEWTGGAANGRASPGWRARAAHSIRAAAGWAELAKPQGHSSGTSATDAERHVWTWIPAPSDKQLNPSGKAGTLSLADGRQLHVAADGGWACAAKEGEGGNTEAARRLWEWHSGALTLVDGRLLLELPC